MSDAFRHVRYLRSLLLALALGACAVIAVVWLVDPYGLYDHAFERRGVNVVKPALSRYQDEIKSRHALALAPAIVILGNSRAEIGFDPDGPALAALREPGRMPAYTAYNLAISGSSIAVARRQLEYLVRMGKAPRMIILGVEFLDFIDAPGTRPAAAAGPSPAASQHHPAEARFWRFDSLFSLTALEDALTTLRIQHADDAETMTARGYNPLREYAAMARREGYAALFRQRAQENARIYLRKAGGRPSASDAAHLAAMLALASRTGIEVRLLIYPYHAQILALFEASGLWPAFTKWKADLLEAVLAARRRDPAVRIALYDFSGYGHYNCEAIPAPKERPGATRWYWEGGHFKGALGERVLARVLDDPVAPSSDVAFAPASRAFGFRLEPGSLDADTARIALERAACARAYPTLFADSAALVAAARGSY
jgi:hypothetical protein